MTRLTVAACSSVLLLSATAFAQQAPPAPSVAVTAPAPALRMAFVDLQRVAAESTEGKAANAKVQQLTQTKANDISTKTKQLDAANQKMQQGGAVLNDAARATLQKEVDRLTVEIDRLQQDAQAEVQEFQQAQLADFQDKLKPVVEGLVKELGVGLLFSMGDAGAIFVDPSLDITLEVIKRFDAASAAKPGAPGCRRAENHGARGRGATGAAAPKPAAPATPAPTGRGAAPAPGRGAPPAPAKTLRSRVRTRGRRLRSLYFFCLPFCLSSLFDPRFFLSLVFYLHRPPSPPSISPCSSTASAIAIRRCWSTPSPSTSRGSGWWPIRTSRSTKIFSRDIFPARR